VDGIVLGFEPFVPHNLILGLRNPVPLLKFQMAPILRFLISSGSKRSKPDVHV
jgi:hypothetical protein